MTEQSEKKMEEKTIEKTQPFQFKYDLHQSDNANTKKVPLGVSLQYGSVTTIGVTQFINYSALKFDETNVICDFGMGYGKLILQIFEECDWIHKLIGIELNSSRYDDAVRNLRSLASHLKKTTKIDYYINDSENDRVVLKGNKRELIMENGSITDYPHHIKDSDVSFLHIAFNSSFHEPLGKLISSAKKNSFIISYLSLDENKILNKEYTDQHCTKTFRAKWNSNFTPYVYIKN